MDTSVTTARQAPRRGDLYALGEHRLLCGDATCPEDVVRLLGDEHPNLMVTDPPYGVNYDPAWRAAVIDAASGRSKAGRALGAIPNDHRAEWSEVWALFPGDVAYVWHGALNGSLVEAGLVATGFQVRSQIIWDKGRLIISRGHYHWKHEPCWYAVRRGRTAKWAGDRRQVTVWTIPHRKSATGHSAQKPVECMLRPMLNHTHEGDAVFDPFVGSGATIVAAEQCGRRCFAIEIDPGYVEMALARWEALTDRAAALIS